MMALGELASSDRCFNYVSCGTHPAFGQNENPARVFALRLPARGRGLGNPHGVGLRTTLSLRAPFEQQADAQRFLAELRHKLPVCRIPESLLIIHNTQRE
jgi:hypothetical protein